MFTAPAGINFSSNVLTAPDLAHALRLVAAFIQAAEPHGTQLQKSNDWLEHDGLWFQSEIISVHDLFEIVNSPRSILQNMPDDEQVFIGISPVSGEWYLRFYLAWDDEGFTLAGRFDITLPPSLSPVFREKITDLTPLAEQDSTTYFSRLIA